MLEGYNIICLGNSNWDGHKTSKQQIMSRLSRKNRVLYVNKGISLLSPFTGWDETTIFHQLRDVQRGTRQIHRNLFVSTPPIALPLRFYGIPNRINGTIMTLWLKAQIERLKLRNPILWTFLPESARLICRIEKCLSVYHCVDEYSAVNLWWKPSHYVVEREVTLLRAVDIVITTSRNLYRKKKLHNQNCYFVANAVDFGLFSKALDSETQIPSEISNIPKPIIGYVGMLYPDLINVDFIEYAAKNSGYSFVFIGGKIGTNSALPRLMRLNNVHFLGFKDPSHLPAYLKGIDVCMMPSVKSRLSEAVFPLKLFEYLAAGKPVVATRTSELEPYAHLISLVDSPMEFLQAINDSLRQDDKEKAALRINEAKANTWENRVETISSIVEAHLRMKWPGHKPIQL